MTPVAWTLACSTVAALLATLYVAVLLAGEAARREAFLLFKRLLFEKTFREILPTTRPAWEAAARYAEILSGLDEDRAADLIRRAADASRRKADRMDAVRRVMMELEKPPPAPPPAARAPLATSLRR